MGYVLTGHIGKLLVIYPIDQRQLKLPFFWSLNYNWGGRNFTGREEYKLFIRKVIDQLNSGRIGRPTKYKSLCYGTSLYNKGVMSSYKEIFKFSGSKQGKFRLKVIEHFKNHGLLSCMDAYGVSKATIYRRKKPYDRSGKKLSWPIPKSRSPVNRREMLVRPELINFIRELRRDHYRLGKEEDQTHS